MKKPSKKGDLKKTVRELYGSIGQGNERSCCGSFDPENIILKLGYSPDILTDIPEGANLGLGCGNPVGIASVKKGETVLDLGSGAGFDCIIAAREVGEDGKVIGVDMTPEMLEKARGNVRKAGIQNVEFHQGEIEKLPLEDNFVDVVISNCVVNISTDKQAVYREAFRVLKPGGRIAISDILAHLPLPDELQKDEKLVAGCIGGAISVEKLYAILVKAGFTDISIVPKNNSDDIISGWQPGDSIEDYIFSAYISALKPATIEKDNPMSSKEYFENIAHEWDEMRQNFFPESVREVAYKAADIKPGQVAADIGAGTGFITEGLLYRDVKVIAVDQSSAMLDRMKAKFGADGNVTYLTGDSLNIPIANETVNAVFANMYLHHVESPPDAIRELVRILKPGGVLIITDLDKHSHDFLVTEQHDRWMGFEREKVISWFEEAGLRQVNVDCVGDDCCARSKTADDEAKVSIFIAAGRK